MRKSTSSPLAEGSVRVNRCEQAYAARVAPTMTAPPMVGVPRLMWWEVGPSSRTNWPKWRRTRNLMNHGVSSRENSSDVAAPTSTPFTSPPPLCPWAAEPVSEPP